jgi:hypothetical protein
MSKIFFALAVAFTMSITSSVFAADIRDSEPAREAAKALSRLAQGNEGSGGWESLTMTDNRVVEGVAFVRSRHVTRIPFPGGPRTVTVYDWTVKANVRLDLVNGGGNAVIDFGRGIKINASQLITILSTL